MREKVFIIQDPKYYPDNWYIMKGVSVFDFIEFLELNNLKIKIRCDIEQERLMIKNKLCKLNRIKYLNICLGTTIIYNNTCKNKKILKTSHDLFFRRILKTQELRNGIEYFISVHDYDWNAIVYFKYKQIMSRFLDYIKDKSKLIESNDWSDFQ